MRFLLLIFFILWSVHSAKQFKLDYGKCTTDYYCMVIPADARKPANNLYLAWLEQNYPGFDTKLGILIKPLSIDKWLVVMHNQDEPSTNGIYLTISNKVVASGYTFEKEIVAGCGPNGILQSTLSGFSFEGLTDDTVLLNDKKIICVGILTGTDLVRQFNGAQSAYQGIRLVYYKNIKIGQSPRNPHLHSRHLHKPTAVPQVYESVDFAEVYKLLRCDFSLLRPALTTLSYSHDPVDVETFSDSIDCTNNLFTASDTPLDLLVKRKGATVADTTDKITCKNKVLSYQYESSKVEIKDVAEVACGRRKKCALLKPVNKPVKPCDEKMCSQEKMERKNCDTTKDQCESIECPGNRWIINQNTLYTGPLECRRESIDEKSGLFWHAKIDGKPVRVDEGSCNMNIDCHIDHKIETRCEKRDKCFKATIGPSAVYCPKHYDMMYFDGKDNHADNFRCNLTTGEWNQTRIVQRAEYVFCLYNANKENILLGGVPIIAPEGWSQAEPYMLGVIGTLAGAYITILLVHLILKRLRSKRRLKAAERRKDHKLWTPDERFRVRPVNEANDISALRLCYKDLRTRGSKTICEGLHLDFNLYSPEERVKYLENLLREFASGPELIRMTVPLLAKCTELGAGEHYVPHAAPVKLAFTMLKLLANAYGYRGDLPAGARIREAISTRSAQMLTILTLERRSSEDEETALIRSSAIDAMCFCKDKGIIEHFLGLFKERGRGVAAHLRQYVWAVACSFGQSTVVDGWLEEEFAMIKAGTQKPDDSRFGTRLEHYVFALCAAEPHISEPFLNYVVNDPFFTAKHILAGFQAMIEVFSENRDVAARSFTKSHKALVAKMPVASAEYKQLWHMLCVHAGYALCDERWLWHHVTTPGRFSLAEKHSLDLASATTFGGIYSCLYNWKDVVNSIEYELSEKGEEEQKAEAVDDPLEWYDPDNPHDQAKRRQRDADRLKRGYVEKKEEGGKNIVPQPRCLSKR